MGGCSFLVSSFAHISRPLISNSICGPSWALKGWVSKSSSGWDFQRPARGIGLDSESPLLLPTHIKAEGLLLTYPGWVFLATPALPNSPLHTDMASVGEAKRKGTSSGYSALLEKRDTDLKLFFVCKGNLLSQLPDVCNLCMRSENSYPLLFFLESEVMY